MAPIRYSLHYEDYSEHLMSRFGKLLQMQSLVDMTLMCSSHTLRVHKAVLAASSAYFQEVLQKQSGEPLIILKMRFSVLKCLVEFMYCGKTQCLEENLDELVSAAQFLKIKGLSKVTKEGLGINNQSKTNDCELPVFTPPVVINRPPQSLIELHSQEDPKLQPPPPLPLATNANPALDNLSRPKDLVVRIPFDIENGSNASNGVEYPQGPRVIKPRRGRPSVRRAGGWDSSGLLGRAAERALLRREQDSRKAIHQLKHLQTRHMQDYMDRVTLSQAVNSICGPDSTNSSYMNLDNDLVFMDHGVPSNVLDSTIYNKDHPLGSETITSSYVNTPICSSANEPNNSGISTAMSQYVNALKNAGLPTDLPILFESGDGSYINVNEQVLLDMVQSSEIQYEVIEQPNIIEKVADPSEIKSIDDLSKSIERGEMLLGSKNYSSSQSNQYSQQDEAISSLSSILPDNLESFSEQQNFVVLDPPIQEGSSRMDNTHDFTEIDSEMQFFTKSMSDDVKKYYEEQELTDDRVIDQLCPTSTSLDTSFTMSLLDTKSSQINEHLGHQYNPLNPEDDFSLQLPTSADFKEDALDCLMAGSKQSCDNNLLDKTNQERDDIIKDLLNIEDRINITQNAVSNDVGTHVRDFNKPLEDSVIINDSNNINKGAEESGNLTSSGLQWKNIESSIHENQSSYSNNDQGASADNPFPESVIDFEDTLKIKTEWNNDMNDSEEIMNTDDYIQNNNSLSTPMHDDIPYAMGLLPLKKEQSADEGVTQKRKQEVNVDLLENVDANCLKRKIKYKKLQ